MRRKYDCYLGYQLNTCFRHRQLQNRRRLLIHVTTCILGNCMINHDAHGDNVRFRFGKSVTNLVGVLYWLKFCKTDNKPVVF